MKTLLLIAVLALTISAALFLRKPANKKPSRPAGAPQLEVGDTFMRPDGGEWPRGGRSIIIATSSTCGACSENQAFERDISAGARLKGIPLFYLVSSETSADIFARDLGNQKRKVIRADLGIVGVNRTPTIMAVDPRGRIIATRIGSVFATSPQADQLQNEILFGTTRPLYGRITNGDLPRRVADLRNYQIIELRDAPTPLPKGLRYRLIPPGELSVRAAHEITPDSTVFVDCNSVKSPFVCQNALLILANIWTPDHLFAIGLPLRATGT